MSFSVFSKDFLWIYKLSKSSFSFILVFRVSSFQFGDYMNLCGLCISASTSNSASVSGNIQNTYIPHLIDRAWIRFLIIIFCSMFPLHFSRKWQYTFKITLMCQKRLGGLIWLRWASQVTELENQPAIRRRRRFGFNPWCGKILWRRAWQPTPVLLTGESPWIEEPGGLQSMRLQRVGHDWALSTAQSHHAMLKSTPIWCLSAI